MPTLGIITCQILELEFAYILSNNPDVAVVRILENPFAHGFCEAMERIGGRPVERIRYLTPASGRSPAGLDIVVRVMEVGLHSVIQDLKDGVRDAASELADGVDAILVGYGLCGNAFQNPDELFADIGVPIFMPMDGDHVVDDCVGLVIGGREHYYEEQCRCAGTMFLTPGWTRHWKKVLLSGKRYDLKMLKRLMAEYKRLLILPTPVMSEEEMAPSALEFIEMFGLEPEIRPGTLSLLDRTWAVVKNGLLSMEPFLNLRKEVEEIQNAEFSVGRLPKKLCSAEEENSAIFAAKR
jgi:Protein of unknown function (DUF1638)